MPSESHPDSITFHFAALIDPRVDRTKAHSLRDILVIALCAMLCGAVGFVDFEEFGKCRRSWLRAILELPDGILSHDIVHRADFLGEQRIALRTNDVVFEALLSTEEAVPQWANLVAGSRVAISGICVVSAGTLETFDRERKPDFFRLLLRSASDVTVLSGAPWWTVRRTCGTRSTLSGLDCPIFPKASWLTSARQDAGEKRTAYVTPALGFFG